MGHSIPATATKAPMPAMAILSTAAVGTAMPAKVDSSPVAEWLVVAPGSAVVNAPAVVGGIV
jgi:hypothetical protein